jgi:hypothetical protein
MTQCCPPGQGCNAPGGDEPCALDLCAGAAASEDEAALALERWRALQQAQARSSRSSEQRFRRRAFQRARDRALLKLAMRPGHHRDASLV